MKRILAGLLFFPFATLQADVVLLRDGSVLRGKIKSLLGGLVIDNIYGTFNIKRKDFHKAYRPYGPAFRGY